jgi:para-aminobenzoate synthetase component 1
MTPFARSAVREVPGPPNWDALLDGLRRKRGFWLLEDARPASPRAAHAGAAPQAQAASPPGGVGAARWSFAGCDPALVLRSRGDRLALDASRPLADRWPPPRLRWRGDPLAELRAWLPRAPRDDGAASGVPFSGGLVGWLGYELAARLERLAWSGLDDVGLPELRMALADRVLARDAASGRLWAAALGFGADPDAAGAAAARAAERLAARVAGGEPDPFEAPDAPPWPQGAAPAPGPEPLRLVDPATGLALGAWFDEAAYQKAVRRVQEAILAGDVYQANLTHRLAAPCAADPWSLYTTLRRRNPAPFAAFLATPDAAVVGSSPECFLRLAPDGTVESRPIKGTRPRGATPAADAALRASLSESAKERAENVMIVDLVRNDLGRACVPGSVAVPALFALEPHATVWQMVSTVRGRLRPGLDAVDALCAAFPPGSMTGAPKLAAIELLAGLEPVRRGAYAGALGWLDARGGAELAVVIRTLFVRPGRAWLHVGGGIVLDSEPAAEWAETLAKARAALDALAAAPTGGDPALRGAGAGVRG